MIRQLLNSQTDNNIIREGGTYAINSKIQGASNIAENLENININFVNNKPNIGPIQAAGKGRGWATAGADVVAGLGAMAGLASWWGLGPIAAVATGFVGGVAAAVASAEVYRHWLVINSNGGGNNNNYTSDQQIKAIINYGGSDYVPNPYNNPYESVGIRHNQLVQILYSKPYTLPFTDKTLIFDNCDLTNDELLAISKALPIIGAIYRYCSQNSIVDTTNSANTSSLHSFINFVAAYAQNPTLIDIITIFLNGLRIVSNQNTATVMSFINVYENYFINTCCVISSHEKQTLLCSFAIAKHSYTLWSNVLSN